MSATVYFSPVITPEKVLDMFKLVDKTLSCAKCVLYYRPFLGKSGLCAL